VLDAVCPIARAKDVPDLRIVFQEGSWRPKADQRHRVDLLRDAEASLCRFDISERRQFAQRLAGFPVPKTLELAKY
jgi:hypothetical protein